MEEKNLNFDEVIDRRNTDCLKFDFAERRGKPADVLPLWVADMDFKTSSLVLDALTERVQHGILATRRAERVISRRSANGWKLTMTGRWNEAG